MKNRNRWLQQPQKNRASPAPTLDRGEHPAAFTRVAVAIGLLVGAALLTTGCGKQAFQQTQVQDLTNGAGYFEIPAKVDILLAQDDSASAFESYNVVHPQMLSLLSGVEAKGWDFHFATAPITRTRNITQVAASRFDTNWGSLWQAPWPGATPSMVHGNVSASAFRTAPSVAGFPQFGGWVTPNSTSSEPAFQSVWNVLSHSTATSTGFLRNDALLIVFLLSNGEDTTGYTLDSYGGCSGSCATNYENSFNLYRGRFQSLKTNPTQAKWFSAVAHRSSYSGSTCLTANSYKGTRYMRMASEMGGQSYDLCTQPISNAVEGFSSYLQNLRQAYRTRYIFVSNEPDFDREVTVTKITGGVSYDVPEHAGNGWSYVGWQDNVYALELDNPSDPAHPILMSPMSGYAFRLNGSSALEGDDTASVQYFMEGAEDSIAE